jgi:predicted cobalt transporter CbtA
MKTKTFIAISLLAGAIAGTFLSTINQGIVEPYIERAIAIENQKAAMSGEMLNPLEFNSYRVWQKTGEIAAGTILGTAYGSLFGMVFVYARESIPGSTNVKKALILGAVLLFVLYMVPGLKYPANPPAVGDPETIGIRQTLYISYLSISGFSALGLAVAYRKLGKSQIKKVAIPVTYGSIMLAAYFAMPPNSDAITAPMDLVVSFRLVTGFTISMFWGLLGFLLGWFWDKTKPHETTKITA